MRRLITTAAAVLIATALMAAPVGAITNGAPDGNAHASVGALLYHEPGADGAVIGCTGTLIGTDPAVFLTAGHCVFYMDYILPAGLIYSVSFDADLKIDPTSGLVQLEELDNPPVPVTGREMMQPFTMVGSAQRDVGVLFLASGQDLPDAVALPPLGAAEDSVREMVVNVGYGWTSLDRSPSSPNAAFTTSGLRMTGTAWVSGVSPNWLTAHSALASTCYHDSGGPQFAGAVMVSITVGGDMPCANLQRNQRLDLADVREWLLERLH